MLMRIASCAALAAIASAQTIPRRKRSFGITGGAAVTQRFYGSENESKRYTFGPRFDLWLTENISVAMNPLYKRTGYSFGYLNAPPPEIRPEPLAPWFAGVRFAPTHCSFPPSAATISVARAENGGRY
jgi:hypothetical protein